MKRNALPQSKELDGSGRNLTQYDLEASPFLFQFYEKHGYSITKPEDPA